MKYNTEPVIFQDENLLPGPESLYNKYGFKYFYNAGKNLPPKVALPDIDTNFFERIRNKK